MKTKGISIDELKARQLKPKDFDSFDHIFVMDKSNLNNTLDVSPSEDLHQKVRLFLSLNPNSPTDEVPDPYFGGEEGFEYVYRLLDEACEEFLREL
jgi:protein-tyrosine phosphatase